MDNDKTRSAILLVEFQNQWTQKGLYNWLIKKQLDTRDVLRNTQHLVEHARKQGIKIIHAPLVIDPKNKKGWLAWLTLGKVFTKGAWGSDITDSLFEKGDLLVKGRYAFDAFVGSNLEAILKEHVIENIFVCGFTTDQCVARTIQSALNKKFNTYLVSDCTATLNDFLQKKTERKFADRVIDSKDDKIYRQ